MKQQKKAILFALAATTLLVSCAIRRYLGQALDGVEASGTIETTEVDVSFQVAGKVEERFVQEGEHVEKSQMIARLDLRPLQENLARTRAQLEAAKQTAQQLRDSLDWTRRTIEEQERAARAAEESAQARFQEVKTGPRIQEVRQAEAALAAAEANLTKARLDLDRAKELVRKKVYSQAALDTAEAAFIAASSQKDAAQEALNLVREGSRKEQIESADAALRQARATLAQATANRIQVAMKEKDLAVALAHVKELEASLNIAKINLDYGELVSPIAGWVLLKSVEPGEFVNAGIPVVTLGDIEDLWMNVYVGPTVVGKVHLGDPVDVRVDAHTGQVFEGKIVFISQEAEFTPKNIQTKDERTKLVYRLKVAIRNEDQKLKPGMPADATLRLH